MKSKDEMIEAEIPKPRKINPMDRNIQGRSSLMNK
jgi:hypothetical protein